MPHSGLILDAVRHLCPLRPDCRLVFGESDNSLIVKIVVSRRSRYFTVCVDRQLLFDSRGGIHQHIASEIDNFAPDFFLTPEFRDNDRRRTDAVANVDD